MLRDLLAKDQSNSHKGRDKQQENRNPTGEKPNASRSQPHKDEEDFVPVNHEDVEDVDDDDEDESEMERVLRPFLGLQRQLGQRERGGTPSKYDNLHPYTQILGPSNLEQCVALEDAAFPEHERCSREKFIYRLTRCPELSLGLFSRPTLSEAANATSPIIPDLVAHVIATRTPAPAVTDASMSLPDNWKTRRSSLPGPGDEEPLGHQEQGSTIAVHSVAVAVRHQKKGLGSVLLKAYCQRIKDSKIADRIALLAHDHLINFYEGLGFVDMGPSAATFGGGGWHNMILEFNDLTED